jgi:hypothetical protein
MDSIVSLEEVKAFMQITTTASDALIQSYIDLTQAEIEAVIGRNLARATYTEVLVYKQSRFDKSGYTYLDTSQDAPVLFLKNTPIVNLTLEHGGVVPTTSYTYDPDNGVLRPNSQLYRPTATYVAGYTTATAPADLKGVVKLGVVSLFENNKAAKQGSGNVQSKRIKDFSVTYGNNQNSYIQSSGSQLVKTYIASNMAILNKYQNINL